MTDIEVYRQPAAPAVVAVQAEPDLDSWVTVVQEVSRLAGVICETDFVPKAYRGNAAATTAAILAGRELGLPPMTALRHMQVVEGMASLSAEYKRARVLAAGHEFDVIERTTEKCVVSGRRRGSTKPPLRVEFTIQDAQRARLIRDRGAWQTRPRRMLYARASTELCDTLFTDVTNGLPTTELLTGDGDGFGGYDEQPAEASKPTGRVTAAEITGHTAPLTASPATPAPRAPEPQPTPPAEQVAGEARSSGPAPSGQPAGNEPAAGPDESYGRVPLATGGQVGIIASHFKRLGYGTNDRTGRLRVTAKLAGLDDLGSTKELDQEQAARVIERLSRCKDFDAIDALLSDGEVPSDV